ncbi:hypothetical protein AcV7_004903 [Taiwanofungus camphoratus]|nr:hypothetical protein AcV7_004903 [Antrodia cinnamomea]
MVDPELRQCLRSLSGSMPDLVPQAKNLANWLVLNGGTCPSADLAQFDRIDEQLREAMPYICSARNSMLHVNRLPPEVMSLVFEELASSTRRELNPQRPTKRFMDVAVVCRHWRPRRAVLPCALGHSGHRQADVARTDGTYTRAQYR